MAENDFFLDAMRRRYACKRFKKGFPIREADIQRILEYGRLSPSSFGLEPWTFIVVASPEKIASLGDACFSQEPLYTCSFAMAIIVPREAWYDVDSEFVRSRAERFPGGYAAFVEDYRDYHDFLEREGRLLHWAKAQTYIACANMMTGAASIGLDSCPIEGFDEARVLETLDRKSQDWSVGIVVAFGQRDEEARLKIREPLSALSERM